jgi:hypothetical protein
MSSRAENLVFGNYATSATFCLKLGKTEIAALGHLNQARSLRDSTDPAFWSLASKGLIEASAERMLSLTQAGIMACALLEIAGLISQ